MFTHIEIPQTSNLYKFGFWDHLFHAAGLDLWSKYNFINISILGTHFKGNSVLIYIMQIFPNKIDSEGVDLLKYIPSRHKDVAKTS